MEKIRIREELNQISADRFHNKKITCAINLCRGENSLSFAQIQFDRIRDFGSLLLLYRGDVCVCTFDKEIFKLNLSHYQNQLISGHEIRIIHYNLYV